MKLKTNTALRICAWIAFSLAALALDMAAPAQGVGTTTVQGTVYLANGKPGSGTVQISWPAFSTSNNLAVAAGHTNVTVGSDGFLSVNLTPNLGASPAGLFYTAVYHMNDGTTSTEYWVVPAAPQVALGQVRAQVMPAAQAAQAVSKAYVDQAIQSLAQGSLTPVGGTLSGPLYLSGDPTQSLQAADKHYVDASFAQAMPLAGGAATGPLTATELGAVWQVDQFAGADFGAKLQACVSGLNPSYGGTCDARNFSGTVAMTTGVTISTANTTILLPCATLSTSAQIVITAGTRNVSLRGCSLRGSSAAGGNIGGTVFQYAGSAAMIQVGDPTYAADTQGFHLDNAVINTTTASSATAQAFAAYRTQELDLQSLYLLGNSNQTGMTLDGTGNYTGGTLYGIQMSGYLTAINGIGHQIANPATTDWVNASTFVRLHIDCPTANGSPIAGTTGINLAQGDGNTFTGGDVEGCSTALHLGPNAQNNTLVGVRNENSSSQVVADAGSSYNNWITGGTMFTGKLTDNGTRNSFLDTFHRSFNGLNGDWYGSQQDATVTNHFRLGTGTGNERGLYNRYQTDYGYRWTTGLSDAAAGEQFYQVLDELNNVYRLSIGQYNAGQSSTNNQTVINAAGSGAVVLNGSNNSGTGGVVFGSGGPSETTVATINNAGNAQFNGSLQVGGPTTFSSSTTVRNSADAEVDQFLWAGATANQKESFIYKDYTGASQWYMVKDASNNWALNSALGNIDSLKAYQSNNSGDTYLDASNSSGVVRVNYESGAGSQFKIYGGNSNSLYASFTAPNAIQLPGLAASSGTYCLQVDNSGYLSNTGSPCGTGGSLTGTVNAGVSGQIAVYSTNGTALSGVSAVPVSAGGTGATTAAAAIAALGAASLGSSGTQSFAGPLTAPAVNASVNGELNVMAPPYSAKGDCSTDDTAAFAAAQTDALKHNPAYTLYLPLPPGGCYLVSLNWQGVSMRGQSSGMSQAVGTPANVTLQSKPGQDVLHALDPLTNNYTFRGQWSLENITLQVDDTVAAAFPHRWPGRWFDDAAMTAGSNVIKSANGGFTCGDIGQAIQVNGADASGANLVTTIANVNPCWMSPGNPPVWQVVTLAAAASTTVSNAHTYVSLLSLPVTANIGACDIGFDMQDGNSADWITPSMSYGNGYDTIRNVAFRSKSGASYGQNNSCGIYTQGGWGFYGLDARNTSFLRTTYGVVQGSSELNSWYQSSSNDFQKWDHGLFNLISNPWISYNGGDAKIEDFELTTLSGFQILGLGNRWADNNGGWYVNIPEFENASGYGFNITGHGHTIVNTSLGGNATYPVNINTTELTCIGCSSGSQIQLGGVKNTVQMASDMSGVTVTDTGLGNSVTYNYQTNPFFGFIGGATRTAVPRKGEDAVAGRMTADFIEDGNYANPYNHDDLLLWPRDRVWNGASSGYSTGVVTDTTSPSGAYFVVSSSQAPSGFSQFQAPGSQYGNIYIGPGGPLPATGAEIYLYAKCPAAGNVTLQIGVSNPTTHSSGVAGSQVIACTTSYAYYAAQANFSAYSAGGYYLNPSLNGAGELDAAWIAIRPNQADYNGYQPAHGGANSDITSLAGLTTPLSPAQGGTGAGALTGYRYANGAGADTASTTIPASALSNGITGTGAFVLASGPTFKGNTTTFANAAAAEQDVVIQPGSGAEQAGAVALASYNGTVEWKLRKDASNYLRFTDAVNSLDRAVFYQNGQSILNAGAGSNAVVLNGSSGSGTGGLLVQNGGSSPATVLTVTGSGNTTATGFVAGKAFAGSGTMTLAAGSAAGSSPTLSCVSGHVCDGISGAVALTTGASPATGTLATLTFPSAHTNSANCIVAVTSGSGQITSVTWSESASALTLTANTALSASTAYQVRYWCGGN